MKKKLKSLLIIKVTSLLFAVVLFIQFFNSNFLKYYWLQIFLFLIFLVLILFFYLKLKDYFRKEFEINFGQIQKKNDQIKENILEVTNEIEALKKETNNLRKKDKND